jgi:ABC-type sugar transport system permease subunit
MIKEMQTAPGPASMREGKPTSWWSRLAEKHPVLLFTLPAGIVVFGLMVFPVFYTVYMSLHSWFASSLTTPEFIGVRNFVRAFTQDERFRNAFVLTIYFTVLATAMQLVLGVALAFSSTVPSAARASSGRSSSFPWWPPPWPSPSCG